MSSAPVPEAYVHAWLYDGPHDGESVVLPWAPVELPMQRWEDNALLVSVYRLVGPWRGQDSARYEFKSDARKANTDA